MRLTLQSFVDGQPCCAKFLVSSRLGFVVTALAVLVASVAIHCPAVEGGPTNRIEGIAIVVDGDSLRIAGEEVHLCGIDAPEIDQTCMHKNGLIWFCGEAGKAFLNDLIDRHKVECVVVRKGQHDGGVTGMCNANGVALGASSVAHGMAIADRETSGSYVDLEKQARQLGAGIWSGVFEDPKAYRTRMKVGR